jgi:dihydrofolate reductase
MGRLIYSAIGSLDGYLADAAGRYDWAEPGEDLIDHLNQQLESISTYLYGRRMYQEMTVWETDPGPLAEGSPATARFAELWQRAAKVVFSTTLTSVSTARTRLVRSFDANVVRALKQSTRADLSIDGATIAAPALRAGLVDEIHRYVVPVMVGGGTPLYPPDARADLDLLEQRGFDRGITLLRYRLR